MLKPVGSLGLACLASSLIGRVGQLQPRRWLLALRWRSFLLCFSGLLWFQRGLSVFVLRIIRFWWFIWGLLRHRLISCVIHKFHFFWLAREDELYRGCRSQQTLICIHRLLRWNRHSESNLHSVRFCYWLPLDL